MSRVSHNFGFQHVPANASQHHQHVTWKVVDSCVWTTRLAPTKKESILATCEAFTAFHVRPSGESNVELTDVATAVVLEQVERPKHYS